MKNRLIDLNNHLFAQLERLSEEGMSSEAITQEVQRTDAIVAVSEQLIRTADISLKAASLVANHGDRLKPMLPMVFQSAPHIEGKAIANGSAE